MGTPVKPYADSEAGKKEQVAEMFDNIAHRYDLLNHALTAGIDILWRRKAIRRMRPLKPQFVVDIATGTGDFAIEAAALLNPRPTKIIGIDISEGMLEVGREKMMARQIQDLVEMRQGDSENLDIETDSVDAVTVGFGVRNFENLEAGLAEIRRILRHGGKAFILEPAFPRRFPMKQLFGFYFTSVLPAVGKLVSKDDSAYTYLPSSVEAFPTGHEFLDICTTVGFSRSQWHPLTFGTCALYELEA